MGLSALSLDKNLTVNKGNMYKLIKISKPSWTKEFSTVEELTEEVYKNTCDLCKDSYGTDLESMLCSDCGCEYEVEGIALDGSPTEHEAIQDLFWSTL